MARDRPALRAGSTFRCEKQPATGTVAWSSPTIRSPPRPAPRCWRPAAMRSTPPIAAFFALTVVEPMMVGILGGGMAHIRLADGRHVVIDNQSTAPLATGPTTLYARPDAAPGTMDTIGRKNALGPTAVAAPGNLRAGARHWHGSAPSRSPMSWSRPSATPRAASASRPICENAFGLRRGHGARSGDRAALSAGRRADQPGTRLVTGDYAETLRCIAREGPDLLYTGALGRLYADHMAKSGGYLTREDLNGYRTIERDAAARHVSRVRDRRPPPPSSGRCTSSRC